jgi:hypothetical protein
MAAGLFGALGAIGDTGNQWAESRQMAHDEIVRRLAEKQASQQADLNMQSTRQRIAKEQQDLVAGKSPVALGAPYVSKGKTWQRYQDPISGDVTNKELPGDAPETKMETTYRGLLGIGMSPEQAGPAAIKLATGKITEKREVQPDPTSKTGFSSVYYDSEGTEIWRADTLPPRTAVPRSTDSTSTDAFGVQSHRHTETKPLYSGAGGGPAAGGTGRPPVAAGAAGGPVAQGVPPPGGGAALLQALAAAHPAAPAATPAAAIVQRLAANKAPARPATPASSAAGGAVPAALPQGQGYNIGPYKGLDETGHIPARPGLNPQLVAAANRLFDDSDVTKLGVRGADLQAVTALASKYGWRQGSLTPAQQMQIHQVDNSLKALSDPKMLKLFDSTAGRLLMSTVSLDPTGEGGFAGLEAAVKRGAMSQQQTEYMNALTRLRGVIGGIRGFTGANNSNATADRLLAELPNFTNTKNSADAKDKLDKLRQEVEIIKRLGYFLPDGDPRLGAPTAAPAAQDNPLGLKLPTAGR